MVSGVPAVARDADLELAHHKHEIVVHHFAVRIRE
jgi:hypothetical protein